MDRTYSSTRRARFVLPALVFVLLFLAQSSGAALQKFKVDRDLIFHQESLSPKAEFRDTPGDGIALIDESGAQPVLRKFITSTALVSTTIVSALDGFVFVTNSIFTGPGNNHTGTGSTASSIDWGNSTGWTVTGGTWCHAVPSIICALAGRIELATADPPLNSTNYDWSPWIFHGTGFTMPGGYIDQTAKTSQGNLQARFRGPRTQDGTVPALPLLGIGAVTLSVIALGAAATRRRR